MILGSKWVDSPKEDKTELDSFNKIKTVNLLVKNMIKEAFKWRDHYFLISSLDEVNIQSIISVKTEADNFVLYDVDRSAVIFSIKEIKDFLSAYVDKKENILRLGRQLKSLIKSDLNYIDKKDIEDYLRKGGV